MKFLVVHVVILFFIFSSWAYSTEWYEGGDLNQATVETWNKSSYEQRLATAGDWFVSITNSSNPSLKAKMDAISDGRKYSNVLKEFAIQFEKCVSDTATLNSHGGTFSKPNDKVAELASICYISMYGAK